MCVPISYGAFPTRSLSRAGSATALILLLIMSHRFPPMEPDKGVGGRCQGQSATMGKAGVWGLGDQCVGTPDPHLATCDKLAVTFYLSGLYAGSPIRCADGSQHEKLCRGLSKKIKGLAPKYSTSINVSISLSQTKSSAPPPLLRTPSWLSRALRIMSRLLAWHPRPFMMRCFLPSHAQLPTNPIPCPGATLSNEYFSKVRCSRLFYTGCSLSPECSHSISGLNNDTSPPKNKNKK